MSRNFTDSWWSPIRTTCDGSNSHCPNVFNVQPLITIISLIVANVLKYCLVSRYWMASNSAPKRWKKPTRCSPSTRSRKWWRTRPRPSQSRRRSPIFCPVRVIQLDCHRAEILSWHLLLGSFTFGLKIGEQGSLIWGIFHLYRNKVRGATTKALLSESPKSPLKFRPNLT